MINEGAGRFAWGPRPTGLSWRCRVPAPPAARIFGGNVLGGSAMILSKHQESAIRSPYGPPRDSLRGDSFDPPSKVQPSPEGPRKLSGGGT